MRVYDGETLKDTDPKAKSYQEYRDYAGAMKACLGYQRVSPLRFCLVYSILDQAEVAANPVHLFYVIEQQIEREQFLRNR